MTFRPQRFSRPSPSSTRPSLRFPRGVPPGAMDSTTVRGSCQSQSPGDDRNHRPLPKGAYGRRLPDKRAEGNLFSTDFGYQRGVSTLRGATGPGVLCRAMSCIRRPRDGVCELAKGDPLGACGTWPRSDAADHLHATHPRPQHLVAQVLIYGVVARGAIPQATTSYTPTSLKSLES